MTTRLDIWRLLREHGPLHAREIIAAFPEKSEKAVLNRLSELAGLNYPGLEIIRLARGIYTVKRRA
jgi:hypothetical protein